MDACTSVPTLVATQLERQDAKHNTHHIFSDVVVVDEEGSGLVVDGRHGSIEVHTAGGAHRIHIHLLVGPDQCRQSSVENASLSQYGAFALLEDMHTHKKGVGCEHGIVLLCYKQKRQQG